MVWHAGLDADKSDDLTMDDLKTLCPGNKILETWEALADVFGALLRVCVTKGVRAIRYTVLTPVVWLPGCLVARGGTCWCVSFISRQPLVFVAGLRCYTGFLWCCCATTTYALEGRASVRTWSCTHLHAVYLYML